MSTISCQFVQKENKLAAGNFFFENLESSFFFFLFFFGGTQIQQYSSKMAALACVTNQLPTTVTHTFS
jgi:hypothetical protein